MGGHVCVRRGRSRRSVFAYGVLVEHVVMTRLREMATRRSVMLSSVVTTDRVVMVS